MKMMKSTTGMQWMEHKKTAVITGASSGLGAAMAAEFRRNGFHVVALCRKAPAQGLADEFIAADLTDPEELRAAAKEIETRFGAVDVLVNNAGIGSYATWEELSDAELRREVELDFLAPVALTKELLGCVAAARGAVINISSAAAYIPVACMGAYNAVKAALRMFSVTLQMEVAGRGVRVLNVCPGRVDTGFSSRALGGRKPPETPGRTSSSAEVFARKVFNAYRKRKRELVYPGWYWFAIVFARWFPGCCERINRRVWQLK